MASTEEVTQKAKALGKLFGQKKRIDLDEKTIRTVSAALDKAMEALWNYFPPTSRELRQVRNQRHSVQIMNFMTQDRDRKRVFSVKYLKRKVSKLPNDERKRIAPAKPTKKDDLLNVLLVFYHRRGEADNVQALKQFKMEVEADYHNDPILVRSRNARDFLSELMTIEEVEDTISSLQKKYPKESDLKEFAKIINMKIPAQSRRKNSPKKSIHQRLAEKIHADGSYTRV
ncbi:hypothetical protein ACFL2Q_09905 [Thermodesulfobacteriota bacterium]